MEISLLASGVHNLELAFLAATFNEVLQAARGLLCCLAKHIVFFGIS